MKSDFFQNQHPLLLIPGPIEVSDEVLLANASASVSHISKGFIKIFQETLELLPQLLYTSSQVGSQAFVISGSGTLGWDIVASNLIEPDQKALVLNNGYFGDSFKECLETYGPRVDTIQAELGHTVTSKQVEEYLEKRSSEYSLVTITHCDTSTGVLADARALAKAIRTASPDSLIVLDAVCSVGSEEIRLDDWDLDVVLTASQKGIGIPPGLCIVVTSARALKALENRKSPPGSYYASLKRWLPIMKAYQSGAPSYFATPPTNLITALHTSLLKILKDPELSLEERFKRHKDASKKVKEAVKQLGLKQIPIDDQSSANGMTAIYLPEKITPGELLPKMISKDLIIAGGLHKSCKDRYIRIGHMGLSAIEFEKRNDLDKVIDGLKTSLSELDYDK
ncbi:soluble hydrogenase subunit [Phakopsora pachyrhizi]|uniref:alanine--glyoxylate transaminase n=1 Tax=Phakopsora pachyrhizi TaxID=170000 RepID=A0AAV0BRA6_PHAPC|nr:soluble hydrogenase subunit [Phakopsora pachyrhizi]CAH7689249.1 soluble hydrogenase subunit [Phakopsora pachyrhizi]